METDEIENFLEEMLRDEPDPVDPREDDEIQDYEVQGRPLLSEEAINVDYALEIKVGSYFSPINPRHSKIAGNLIKDLMAIGSSEQFFSTTKYCKAILNRGLFDYSFSIATLHRLDTCKIHFPNPLHSKPSLFLNAARGKETMVTIESSVNGKKSKESIKHIDVPLELNATSDQPGMAHFREDIGVNLFYWYWALLYPLNGPRPIMKKNRRGEKFFYVLKQILARYFVEELCEKRATLAATHHPILYKAPPYFSSLDPSLVGFSIPGRVKAKPQELFRPEDKLVISKYDLIMMVDCISEAIDLGFVTDINGATHVLDEESGIDIIGELIHGTSTSKNLNTYGSLYSLLMIFIAFMHDPIGMHKTGPGVMAYPETALRDPATYGVINYLIQICERHKLRLRPYNRASELGFSGVQIKSLEVKSDGAKSPNTFVTYFSTTETHFSRGVGPKSSPVVVRHRHLNHRDFEITIKVTNSGSDRFGTMRIFLLPQQNAGGWNYNFFAIRRYPIELDRFKVKVKKGENIFIRKGSESSLTKSFEETFQDLRKTGSETEEHFSGCKWPDHMQIPKGTKDGFPVYIFAMVSNYALDQVHAKGGNPSCGKTDLYPDRRAMGFPFDRPPGEDIGTLESFLTPNMAIATCRIFNFPKFYSKGTYPPTV